VKLATFRVAGGDARAGEVRGDVVVAFDDAGTVLDRLASGDRTPAAGAEYPLADVELLAPHVPRAIFGIGLNYRDHAAETGKEPPRAPIVFMKLPSSVAAPNADVRVPPVIRRLDYEAELAVVLGPGATVAGYATADDLSARDLQGREPQWTRAKGFDGSCPFGPWVTTADEVPDPSALRVRSWVNGEPRQDGSTADLIFSIDELIAFIAETITLVPGDLILTGTPAGVGMAMDPPRFLSAGDVVRLEVEGLGAIEHRVA
jgi:2-keto-4-pentenoate hydratase/2-oxohepta-3-ene-1,7-dioic acid hydratase in catechol pathway